MKSDSENENEFEDAVETLASVNESKKLNGTATLNENFLTDTNHTITSTPQTSSWNSFVKVSMESTSWWTILVMRPEICEF